MEAAVVTGPFPLPHSLLPRASRGARTQVYTQSRLYRQTGDCEYIVSNYTQTGECEHIVSNYRHTSDCEYIVSNYRLTGDCEYIVSNNRLTGDCEYIVSEKQVTVSTLCQTNR